MRYRLSFRALIIVLMAAMPVAQLFADGIKALGQGEFLRGRFVQERVLQGFAAPLKSEGSFVLAPGQGLIWRAEKPFAVTTLMTERGLAQQSDGVTTLNLPASRAPFLAELYDMLSGALAGDWRALENDFVVVKNTSNSEWTLQLTPKSSTTKDTVPIARINVSGAEFVEHVEIVKEGGDHDDLTFLDQARVKTPLSTDELLLLKFIGQP